MAHLLLGELYGSPGPAGKAEGFLKETAAMFKEMRYRLDKAHEIPEKMPQRGSKII
jgi:hypothetical protein